MNTHEREMLDRCYPVDRVQEDDVMQAGRLGPGVESVDQIKFAIIERNGQISIIRNE